jgi:ribulose 1,5-bisphosphate synthetase/thiazole synthase
MSITRRELLAGGAGVAASTAVGLTKLARAQMAPSRIKWHREADIVVIGSGATGIPAAIVAREGGSSVVLVEAQNHLGGHAICSAGNLPLGGGTNFQKKWGVKDSPDLVFQDLTDWTVVESNGSPDYRFNE